MGKFEQEASQKLLNRERIIVQTKMTFVDKLLYPYRMFKNWQRERLIRKNIWGNHIIEKLK
jgi:hypothetical protein